MVRTIQHKGHFRWKKHEVFVSEVLWGEKVGLLPVDNDLFTVYFAQFPIARFDSRHAFLMPLPKTGSFIESEAKEGGAPPSSALLPRKTPNEVSGMPQNVHMFHD